MTRAQCAQPGVAELRRASASNHPWLRRARLHARAPRVVRRYVLRGARLLANRGRNAFFRRELAWSQSARRGAPASYRAGDARAAIGASTLRVAIATVVLPGLALAWFTSFSHEVEARYLNYLMPVLALCMGVGIAKAQKPLRSAPLAVAVGCISMVATHASYAGPPTDWYEAAARLEAIAAPDDVVAVFPGYWAATLRRYSQRNELAPVTYPIDLERLLERGKSVILVRNNGRFFGHMRALLLDRSRTRSLFSTRVRDTLEFVRIEARPPERLYAEGVEEPALVLVGSIGSGGYPWARRADAVHAFDRLRPLFASARAVVSGYDAYDPPWYQALRWGVDGLRETRPNAAVVAAMNTAGIGHVALRCAGASCARAAAEFGARGLHVVSESAPQVIDIGGTPVGVIHVMRGPSEPAAGLARRVAAAKRVLPAGGRLVALVARKGDYARTAGADERAQARALIDAGADVVAGVGGYAAREVAVYKNGVIAYSLGTLLRPRALSLSASDSTGIALRIRFPREGAPRYQVFATTFDDQSRPALGRTADIRGLLLGSHDQRRGHARLCSPAPMPHRPMDRASGTRSVHSTAGATCLRRRCRPRSRRGSSPCCNGFRSRRNGRALRPFDGGFAAGDTYAGVRGVLGLGQYRRALELDTGGRARVRLRFRAALPGLLPVAYALPDDRIVSKYIPFGPQNLVLPADGRELFNESVAYRAGWNVRWIDARTLSSQARSFEVELQSHGTHFPVAVDVAGCEDPVSGAGVADAAVGVP